MRSGPSNPRSSAGRTTGARRGRAGFTLAETLAALLFLAIVIPVTIEGLHLASYAGELSRRKAVAVRIGESVLNDLVATRSWQGGGGNGVVREGPIEFRWQARSEAWPEGILRLLTVHVYFSVQGREQDVHVSTLVDLATS